jgi:hypothetical protein
MMATVNINHLYSTIRTFDGDALLSPETLEIIVRHILFAIEEQQDYQNRVEAERAITRGIRDELHRAY